MNLEPPPSPPPVAPPPPIAPPPSAAAPAVNQDEEHLRMLAIGHYVVAGLGAVFACLPIFHLIFGIVMVANPAVFTDKSGGPSPAFVGYLFMGLGAFFVLLGWTCASLTLYSGRSIAKRRRWTFSFVWACLLCTFTPFGTVLGVFTIIVLNRESVKRLYRPT